MAVGHANFHVHVVMYYLFLCQKPERSAGQTWTVSSSKGCSQFPFPLGVGRGRNVGPRDFAYFDFVTSGGIRVSQTHV